MKTLNETEFRNRVEAVETRLSTACEKSGRKRGEVTLLPASKFQPAAAVRLAHEAGFAAVGENRVQEAADKRRECALPGLRWELIGHLQRNKAKLAAETFDRVQSLDSARLAEALEKACAQAERTLPVLLQVNAGDDPAKYGVGVEEADALLEKVLGCAHLRVEGLMTIAPLDENIDVARVAFARLRELRDRLRDGFGQKLDVLSMGMSGDLEAAVAEGSTLVRIGTALFGERPAKT